LAVRWPGFRAAPDADAVTRAALADRATEIERRREQA
jgi:hypothetical protein